jgi:peptide/nickel transport system permease protein
MSLVPPAEMTPSVDLPLPPDDVRRRFRGTTAIVGRLARNPLSAFGLALLGLLAIGAIFAPWIAPYDPDGFNAAAKFLPPSAHHLFGTDDVGRDIFSRVLYGARYSLTAGIVILAIAATVGTVVGLVAGYAGGLLDEVLMRITDMFLAFPALILAMCVAAALGPSLTNAIVATAAVWWPWYARLVRGQVLQLRNETFVSAARLAGARRGRILFRHILPNCTTPIIVQMSLDLGYAILTLAALSFIGLGAQAPTPEWGSMIAVGRDFYLTQWWYVTFPGIAIFIAVLGANLVGDGLQEALSPNVDQ